MIREYEEVKKRTHPKYRTAKEFYKAHDTCGKSFLKYYNRYKQSGKEEDLVPSKRGPRYKTRRALEYIEKEVVELREKGNNRYEIVNILKPRLKEHTPSASGVYNILRRAGLNRLNPEMERERRRIIKNKAGELGHLDCHYMSKSVVIGESKKRYVVCLVDDCTRVAWAEIVEDIKGLTVMFAMLKCLNILHDHYGIKFEEIMTDNGPECGRSMSKKKDEHPLERLFKELGIKHRYTRPYRPQTNGKVERFWRTLEDDMLRGTHYDSEEELKEELLQYLYYYNHERPHQGINGDTPVNFMKKLLPN